MKPVGLEGQSYSNALPIKKPSPHTSTHTQTRKNRVKEPYPELVKRRVVLACWIEEQAFLRPKRPWALGFHTKSCVVFQAQIQSLTNSDADV